MVERARHQRLETAAIELQIFRRVDAGLLGFAHRLGAQSPERDDENIREFLLHLIEQIARIFRAQINEHDRGAGLLQNGIEPICFSDVTQLRNDAEEGFDPPDEVRILRIQDADRGRNHAAATSLAKRTSGKRI